MSILLMSNRSAPAIILSGLFEANTDTLCRAKSPRDLAMCSQPKLILDSYEDFA